MIVEGFKLTLLGVGVVYLFLSLLVVVIKLSSRILKPLTEREEATYNAVPAKKVANRQGGDEQQRLMAVINAAIAAHRARKVAPVGLSAVITPLSKDLVPTTSPPIAFLVSSETRLSTQRRSAHGPGRLFFKDRSALRVFIRNR
ncbi:MAG: OadG family protein [Desulfobulbus sp.]